MAKELQTVEKINKKQNSKETAIVLSDARLIGLDLGTETKEPKAYFDIKRDNELIAAGTHFWCMACLGACLLDDQSPDPRYCQVCYDCLLKETGMDTSRRGGDWKPKIAHKKSAQVSEYMRRNMSTLEGKKITVDIIPPETPKVTHGKRGPKQKTLPIELIEQWHSQGLGSKVIAARLKQDKEIVVSYKTIQRVLSGQRILV